MRRETVDIESGIEEAEDDMQDVVEARDELVNLLNNEYDGFQDVPNKYQQKYEQYEQQRKNLLGQINSIVQFILDCDGWSEDEIEELRSEHGSLYEYYKQEGPNIGPSEFVISEMTGGQLAEVQDTVNARANSDNLASGDAQDMNGTRVVASLRKAVEQAPPGAPDDPADYQWQVMTYLFEKVNNLNTVGDADFQTTSLRQAMETSSSQS